MTYRKSTVNPTHPSVFICQSSTIFSRVFRVIRESSTLMDGEVEKVYVALGNDLQDGFKTLDWTLRKWKSNPISIVILHVSCTTNIGSDFVYTPFGKLPASSVSDEKLEVLNKYEQERINRLLYKYIAFCGKMKAEILKVEKSEETIHKVMIDLISTHRMTKLVMGIPFMKSSSSWKSKSAISGLFYIHQHKPNFCDFFIMCGGKLVFLRDENEEEFVEDDVGVMVAKKPSFRSWFGKLFSDYNSHDSQGTNSHHLSASSKSLDSQDQWGYYAQEIENYFSTLSSLNFDEEICEEENHIPHAVPENADSPMSVAAKLESVRGTIEEAQKIVQKKTEEAKANAERCAKAERAICLCNGRVGELEAIIKEEVLNHKDLSKSLDAGTEQIQEIRCDIQESKNRLSSLVELQSELYSRLQTSTIARSQMEFQLEKAVIARAEILGEIEELQRQRDVLKRRIDFCIEKDAIGMLGKLNELRCGGYRQYTAEDIRLATDDFSKGMRLKSHGGCTGVVYRGRINQMTVAIKMIKSNDDGFSREDFLAMVEELGNIRHPHLVAMIGFCPEPQCIIFEDMHSGSLRDILSSSQRKQAFNWNDRIRAAHDICSGIGFLHMAKPRSISHDHLTASKVLLDRNLAAKIKGYRLPKSYDQNEMPSDIQAFGVLLIQLLTGRDSDRLVEEATKMVDKTALLSVLDETAGQWPVDLAEELGGIAVRCFSVASIDFDIASIREELERIRRKADGLVAQVVVNGSNNTDRDDLSETPSVFLCPILQDIMKNPHIAADGFSYELEAIEEWLDMGRNTSPMTNLRLKHKFLTPNHTLRSLIQEWSKRKLMLPS